MKQRKRTSAIARAIALTLAALTLLSTGITAFAGKTLAESIDYQDQIKLEDVIYNNHYFSDYLTETEKNYSDVAEGTEIKIDVNGYTESVGVAPEIKSVEGKDNVFVTGVGNESVTWTVTVEKAGYYQFNIEYLAIDGNGLPVSRGFMVDGKYPYDELMNVKLYRHWVDSEAPRTNNLGDQVRPSQLENQEWAKTALYDAQGEYPLPLKVALDAGVHTITMVHIDQPIAIAAFSLNAPDSPKSYKEVLSEYKANGYKNVADEVEVKLQAEDINHVLYKTDSGITIASTSDATVFPKGVTSKVYNHIGATSWDKGGEEISWKFTVKESGLYKIAPRYYQGYANGLSSTRQIKIDGVVPFKEFEEVVFTFDERWHTKALADSEGNPYLVYLEKGPHTITFNTVMGDLTGVIHTLNEVTSIYSNVVRNITMITGQSPDLNYDYRLERQIPTLIPTFEELVKLLKECNTAIDEFAVKKTPMENNFTMTIELLEKLINKPAKIPANLADLQSALTNIGSWLTELKKNQFALDYISFVSPEKEVEDVKPSFWDNMYGLFANFILSYKKDYNAIGSLNETSGEYETIDVWVSRGKEWCEILKDMIDTQFTEKYKINVNLNILPAGQLGGGTSPLLLAINAGTEPDVVIGIATGVPVDYAVRGAMADLRQFKDFKEVESWFVPAAFKPVTFQKGVYALPETMSFSAMFYRTDIFEQLDIEVPKSWDDIRDVLLPQLYQYNMQFSYAGDVGTMIFQNNGLYYTETGFTSLLDSPEVMKAVDQHVKMFTDYGCPVSASFLNRFRSGEMPIGLGGFGTYLELIYAAPELTGKWEMVPMPYTVHEDGTINDKLGCGADSCISMLSTAENKDAAWKFMKWYVSAETQASYGRQIESIIGIQSRWNTANLEAFKQLPWSQEELVVIEDFWRRAFNDQNVIGSYMTGRSLGNAINRCIIEGQSVREALEQAVEEVNVELKRKQEMYKLNPKGLK